MLLRSLRSRLLLSHFVVIVVVLAVVGVALLAIGLQPRVRYLAALQRLDIVSRASRNELLRLRDAGASQETFLRVLENTAETTNVRVLIATFGNVRVIYDTQDSNNWVDLTIDAEELPRQLLPTADANTGAGQFTAPDGSRWLVYTRAISSSGFGRQVVVYAVPEPSPLAFLQELGVGRAFVRAGAAALVVSVLLALWISRSVARPLGQMADAAEAIAQGDYDQQLPLAGPEEVQRVAASFNSMSAQVAATRQAQRDFVANVSHDLKTPITSIQGWSQALLDGTAVTPTDQQQAANVIYNESERMGRMVGQLLDLARIESGQIELNRTRVDLADVLASVQQSLLPRAQAKQVHLTLETPPMPAVWGDHDRLVQIFTNLVENSLTHTPPGGRVHLLLRRHGERAVEVVVQDTGEGMTPAELGRVFERFYQVDKARTGGVQRGSGLGLAIVQELVALHNGRIKARSQPGQGSAFIVRLPLSDRPEPSTIIRRD